MTTTAWPKKGSRAKQPWENPDGHDIDLVQDVPLLTSGGADVVAVSDLGRRLGALGFDNTVSRGENPFGIVDATVMTAVHAFRRAYGVSEDPSAFGGDEVLANAHIGPWTATAIRRASDAAA